MYPILDVKNLKKQFGSFTAVNDISFSIKEGEVVGFLGPNGAGKTTTIQILMGITSPTSGKIKYFNKDFFANRQYCLQQINFASAFNTLQGRITVLENLIVFSHLYSIDNPKHKIMDLIHYFDSEDLLNKLYWNLSAGQRTRINIIKSLLNDPKILLLDEPTASLDPNVADKTLSLIEELRENKKISILYTSHDMDEITRICDRVIFLNQGTIVAEDTPINLTKRIGKATLILTFDGEKERMENYLKKTNHEFNFVNKYIVAIKLEEKLIPNFIFSISKIGTTLTDIEVKKPTLEDFFLHIARGET